MRSIQETAQMSSMELKFLLELTEKRLEQTERLLKAIPPCPVHGDDCIPHALEWIENAKVVNGVAA